MLNRLLLASVLLLISSNALAGNTLYGITFISQSITQEITPASGSSSLLETSGTGFGLYIDTFYDDTYRVNTTLSHVTHTDLNTTDFTFTSLKASADYLIPVNASFTFFMGATIGGAAMVFDEASISEASLGTLFGGQVGGIVLLPANIMLEFGYRILPTKIETDIVNTSGAVTSTSSIDELSEGYLSLVILF
jgi:hypothetical protein